jgi:hypothetical protein
MVKRIAKFTGEKCDCVNKDQYHWTGWEYDVYAGPGTVQNKHRFKVHEVCGGIIKKETQKV